ncbi:hypothetical protein HOD75_03370 [archaeon]|jgi:NOL1/NOP2/fmu family ribosome biogenesis protein|nr:hypothetical protein [archaeon]MBT4241913.1 hypothetical protein [archaeon]MBT4418460.1 hypothetical protein [archaeon]
MKTLYSSDKKKILRQLEEQYGIKKLPYLLLQFGKEKIRLYSGNLSTDELFKLDKTLRIETAGLYTFKKQNEEIRLTIDALSPFKNQITQNILEINDKQALEWFKGNDLDIKSDRNFKVLKNQGDLIGCGKSTEERITNFMPKERRIKN